MIAVTCRNGEHFSVDPLHIERIETSPDTVIHLVDGTKYVVDLSVVSAGIIALVQVCAIVVGHVVGVTLAHERALLSARRARASDQLPLVVVMVLFTFGGLGLLFGF